MLSINPETGAILMIRLGVPEFSYLLNKVGSILTEHTSKLWFRGAWSLAQDYVDILGINLGLELTSLIPEPWLIHPIPMLPCDDAGGS